MIRVQSELGSLVGIVNCIEALLPIIPQSQAALTVTSDNDSAVDCLSLQKYHLKASTSSLDMISSLLDLWDSFPLTPIPTRVKGHADQLHRPLTFLEHLNCIVDEYAKEIATYYFTANPPTNLSREVGLSTILINDFHVTSNIVPAISSGIRRQSANIGRKSQESPRMYYNMRLDGLVSDKPGKKDPSNKIDSLLNSQQMTFLQEKTLNIVNTPTLICAPAARTQKRQMYIY